MVDQEVFPTSIPPLWSEEEVKVSEEGFLILKKNMALLTPSLQEQQPLLLHSAERFLKELYPSRRISDILSIEPEPLSLQEQEATSEQGHCDDNDAIDEPSNDGETMDIDCMDIDSVQSTSEEIESEPVPAQETKQMESSEINKPQGRNKTKIKRTESETQAASAVDTTTHQQVYHKLKRCNNMGNRILQLIMDIQSFRHRPIKRDKDADRLSRDQAKVRALEKQQKHILRGKITSSPGMDTATTEDDGTTKGRKEKCVGDKDRKNDNDDDADTDGDADNNNNNDDDDDQLTPSEPNIVRLVRTINSVRAVFPHLLQILNHKRRNDRSLKIRSVEWSSKRRGFCWILGSQVFDTTSSKVLIHAHKDCTFILDSYISAELAQRICNDPMGGSKDFWSKSWIPELQTRSNPTIQDPLAILTAYADAPIRDSIVKKTLECDERLQLDSTISNVQEIHSKYEVAVKKLHQTISKLLKDRFPDARVSIYGSCLSNLSLGKGADVDLSLWLPKAEQLQTDFHEGRIGASKYEKEMKSFVFQVFHKLNSRGKEFRDMHPVTRARVPVVTGTYNFAQNPYSLDGSIHFDVCFLNDIAVANSGLLREYSLIDPRVRQLMMAVKLWAKEHQINSAKDNYISSYAWINLVIFYLQCLGFVPNLQSAALMGIVGFVPNPKENIWHCVNKLETWYLTWEQVHSVNAWSQPSHLSHVSVSALLYGFFEFYSCRFPRGTFSVSIKDGVIQKQKILSKKARLFLSIEDPFETYDSHCPHDLSIPASESGTRDMLEFFRAAEMHLRQILLGKSQHEKLWPEHSIVSNESIQKIQTKPNFKRFANDGGLGRGHGGGRRGGRGLYDHNRKGRGRPSPKPTATDAEKHESKQADSKIFTVGQPVETQTGPKPAVASKSTNVRKKKNNTNNKGDGTVRRKGVDPSSHTADRAGPRVPESSKPKHNNRPRKRPTKKDVGEPP